VNADNLWRQTKHRGKKKRLAALEVKALKRRQAIDPVIGHLKADNRIGRCHLNCGLIRVFVCEA
jgi:IS5 family transposase